jgi:hypothetical protein
VTDTSCIPKKKLKETEYLVENKNTGWIDEGEFWGND